MALHRREPGHRRGWFGAMGARRILSEEAGGSGRTSEAASPARRDRRTFAREPAPGAGLGASAALGRGGGVGPGQRAPGAQAFAFREDRTQASASAVQR